MAIKKYKFSYSVFDAEAVFKVDTSILTDAIAKDALEFFTWKYNKAGNLLDELLKKYALKVIEIATYRGYDEADLKEYFKNAEGFLAIDGSCGIELIYIDPYEFDDTRLDIRITDLN